MFNDSSSPSWMQKRRVKIAGAVFTVALVIVSVTLVAIPMKNDMMPLEKAQALAHANSVNVAFASIPDESAVEIPPGWVVESDEPINGPGSEENLELDESADESGGFKESDADIDSVMDMEEDKDGQTYVAHFDPDVIVTSGDEMSGHTAQDLMSVEKIKADRALPDKKNRCYKNLRACGAKRACTRKCRKKCGPYAIRKCKNKKYCRCFCKYFGKIKKARKCVVYKRKTCVTAQKYLCRRRCKKACKTVLRCYCCPKRKVTIRCYKKCRHWVPHYPCMRCRCRLSRCVRICRFVCTHKY